MVSLDYVLYVDSFFEDILFDARLGWFKAGPAPVSCPFSLTVRSRARFENVFELSDDVFAGRGPQSLCSPGRLLVMNMMG